MYALKFTKNTVSLGYTVYISHEYSQFAIILFKFKFTRI